MAQTKRGCTENHCWEIRPEWNQYRKRKRSRNLDGFLIKSTSCWHMVVSRSQGWGRVRRKICCLRYSVGWGSFHCPESIWENSAFLAQNNSVCLVLPPSLLIWHILIMDKTWSGQAQIMQLRKKSIIFMKQKINKLKTNTGLNFRSYHSWLKGKWGWQGLCSFIQRRPNALWLESKTPIVKNRLWKLNTRY